MLVLILGVKGHIFKFQIQGEGGYVLFCLVVFKLFEDLRKELSIIIVGAYSD